MSCADRATARDCASAVRMSSVAAHSEVALACRGERKARRQSTVQGAEAPYCPGAKPLAWRSRETIFASSLMKRSIPSGFSVRVCPAHISPF